jgi:hypothetical protein
MGIFGIEVNQVNEMWKAFFDYSNHPDDVDDVTVFKAVRCYRNQLLLESDWTQLVDSPVDTTVWATYRQQLRDLPSSNANPRLIIFPTLPE